METPDGKASWDERNRLILVRTAGIVSWIFAAERTLVGLAALQSREGGRGLTAPRTFGMLLLAHAVLLVAAGAGLFRDRRWAWAPALVAAGGAVFLAMVEGLHRSWTPMAVDAAYAVVVAAALLKRRHSA